MADPIRPLWHPGIVFRILRPTLCVLIVMLGVAGCLRVDQAVAPAATTATTVETVASSAVTAPIAPTGFDLTSAVLTGSDGSACNLCVWLASTSIQRRRGLSGVTSLGRADAMAFVFNGAQRSGFWMKGTLIPLAIAFVDDEGMVIDVQQMETCFRDPCPVYKPTQDYSVAVEFTIDEADRLKVERGARFELTDQPCIPF